MFRRVKNRPIGSGAPLASEMEIMWGLTIWTVRNTATTGLLWLHGISIDAVATARDPNGDLKHPPRLDSFDFDIPVPLRMHPGGTITEAWRPDIVDFEDASYNRPVITGSATFSWSAKTRTTSVPLPIEVTDRFTFDGEEYGLDTDSSTRDDGIAT